MPQPNRPNPNPRLRRRLLVGGLGIVAIGIAALCFLFVIPLVAVANAYSAEMLCSDVFVAGRPVAQALADLSIDDLRPLRWMRTVIDTQRKEVRARLPLSRERRARYDAASGCVLETRRQSTSAAVALRAAPTIPPAIDSVAALPSTNRAAVDRVLDEAFAEPTPARPRRTRAVVVMQHGSIVAERYGDGVTADTPVMGWSMTKSVLNALIGVAVRDDKLDVNARTPLRAWKHAGDPRARITVGDLMRMSSGLRFDEGESDPSSDVLRMLYEETDMAAFAASKQLVTTPGRVWKYSSGTAVILSRVLREVLGDSIYRDFPTTALFGPLGMSHAALEADASGTFVGSSYMYATAREWARFGQLYLQDGVWRGKRILPEGWVAFARAPAPAAPANTYGALFWLSTPAEYRGPVVPLPSDIFQAVGHEGQFVTIVPSREVVIVRLGRTRYPAEWKQDRFVAAMLSALPERKP